MNIFNLNLSEYSTPCVKESISRDWVEITVPTTSGKNIRYNEYLIERYRGSTTNGAVLNNIIKLTWGKGLKARDGRLKPNDYARFKMMFPDKDIKNVITDYCILGTGSFQVLIEKGEVKSALHIPRNLLEPEKCNDEGDIEAYYYSDDWDDMYKNPPERIELLDNETKKDGVYLVVFGEYAIGRKYLFNVDYASCLDYAQLEEYIAEYQINDTLNGFSPTTIVNFNNGVTDEEAQRIIVKNVEEKTTGYNGKKTLVSFNNNKENAVTLETVPLNDAPAHYDYLATEAQNKILAGHNVVSSMLVGIAKEGTGFSSNADEIEVALDTFYDSTISYKQDAIIDAIDQINTRAGITLDLTFVRRNEKVEQIADTQLSMSENDSNIFNEFDKISSDLGDEWELIDSQKVDYDTEEAEDAYLEELNTPKLSAFAKLKKIINTGTARPNAKSSQDNDKFKSRYRYEGEIHANSREFCRKMVSANKIYRKEDIVQMGSKVVNQGWGPEGADTYDIFLYKGGGDCGHYWVRETYAKKSDVNNPNARTYTPAEQRKAGEIAPTNDKKVYQKPRDMPNRAFLK